MSGLDKGMPLARSTEQALGASLLREELPLPVCMLRNGALRVNSQTLRAFLAAVADETDADIVLCPHGKTTMSPALFRRQLDDGCWGITLATIHQVRVARRFGVPRILLANQLVGRH